ncbi:MAG: hypothetical protein PVH00_07085, partial [Gemmatimonadota bacterium]
DAKSYSTVWNTQPDDLDPAKSYRIRVLASGGEIGYADVVVVETATGNDPTAGGPLEVVKGSTLPISFRVETGLGERVGTEATELTLGDGVVQLSLPAGALPEDVFITAVPATNLPSGGPPVVPGTAWDFGPDGLTFAHPVVMTIAYDPAMLPPGVDESELRIHKLVNGAYEQQNAGLVDLVNHTVSAEVDGFSVYVVIQRNPVNPEDVEAPEVRTIEVLDPGTGTYGNSASLDVDAGDATLTTRVTITDNITGLALLYVSFRSPSGKQRRYPCYTSAPPLPGGSDTNGTWECQGDFPQYSEGGTWQAEYIFVRDRIQNYTTYQNQPGGFCEYTLGRCVSSVPQVVVNSSTPDTDPPVLQSMSVSPDVQPRMFGPSLTVDVSTGGKPVYFGLQATDNLSGVGGGFINDYMYLSFRGPSGQSSGWQTCTLTQGTTTAGFWECYVYVPTQAETGTWRVDFMRVPDRVGNGGPTNQSYFTEDGNGNLCNQTGNCVAAPTVQVTSAGDSEAPFLQSLSISANGPDVTTTLDATDDITGLSYAYVAFASATSSQTNYCYGTLVSGTTTNGTWSCDITFSQYAAIGQWILSIQLHDGAGNYRYYYRRAADGYLCYYDQTSSTQICQDFGDTDIILQ